MFSSDVYERQYCSVHQILILYFKSNKIMSETQCWDCQRAVNQKKTKAIEVVYEDNSSSILP
jgi:hypothetical protein